MLVGVAPSEGSPRTTAKPSAGGKLGLSSVTVKLSTTLSVAISVGHTISPCCPPTAAVSWYWQLGRTTASPTAFQFVLHRSGTCPSGPTNKAAVLLVTSVEVPLLTTASYTLPLSASAVELKVSVAFVAPEIGVNVEDPAGAESH